MVQLTPRVSARESVDRSRDPAVMAELIVQAVIEGLDETARQMELKWGVGRLRLMVDKDFRMRFDAQKAALVAALASNQPGYICAQAEGMRRTWLTLDRAATEAGIALLAPKVWECCLPRSDEIVSLVRTEAEAHHVAAAGKVWTLAEVAVLIERFGDEIRQVRHSFPGSAVTDIRDRDSPETGDPPF
jgi:hypothetical protein